MPGTVHGDAQEEGLATPEALETFLLEQGWTGPWSGSEAELAAVRNLRPVLRSVWEASEADAVELVNRLLRDGHALPQVVDHDGYGWHIHATPMDAPLPRRMVVEAAMALVDVLRMGELDRLQMCARDDCDDVFVDLSRNRSKRFCDTTCGNRENVAAYRARRAAT